MGNKIVLLSCVKSKREHPCVAEDMYISPLFRKMIAYAKFIKPDHIFILSAQYGLLELHDNIEPYEKTLKNMKVQERKLWSQQVIEKMSKFCDLEKDQFIFLAGEAYRENLVGCIKKYDVPMQGLPFGKQLQWLGKELNE